MSRLSLYRTRKQGTPNLENFLKAEVFYDKENNRTQVYYIVSGVLTPNEIDRCDLNYCGHGMTYETAMDEISRLRRGFK